MHLYSTSNTEVSIHILDYHLNILRVYFYNTSRWGRNTFAKDVCEYWKIFLKIWFPVKWQTITATFFTASASSFCWRSEGCSWLSKVLLPVTRSRGAEKQQRPGSAPLLSLPWQFLAAAENLRKRHHSQSWFWKDGLVLYIQQWFKTERKHPCETHVSPPRLPDAHRCQSEGEGRARSEELRLCLAAEE